MAHEVVELSRDCPATEIPSGYVHTLSAGTPVVITQRRGGSYTVTAGYGKLLRIDAKDADAVDSAVAQTETPTEFSEQLVWEQLRTVYDPEIPVNIVDLGLVYSCEIAEDHGVRDMQIAMTMTAPRWRDSSFDISATQVSMVTCPERELFRLITKSQFSPTDQDAPESNCQDKGRAYYAKGCLIHFYGGYDGSKMKLYDEW